MISSAITLLHGDMLSKRIYNQMFKAQFPEVTHFYTNAPKGKSIASDLLEKIERNTGNSNPDLKTDALENNLTLNELRKLDGFDEALSQHNRDLFDSIILDNDIAPEDVKLIIVEANLSNPGHEGDPTLIQHIRMTLPDAFIIAISGTAEALETVLDADQAAIAICKGDRDNYLDKMEEKNHDRLFSQTDLVNQIRLQLIQLGLIAPGDDEGLDGQDGEIERPLKIGPIAPPLVFSEGDRATDALPASGSSSSIGSISPRTMPSIK